MLHFFVACTFAEATQAKLLSNMQWIFIILIVSASAFALNKITLNDAKTPRNASNRVEIMTMNRSGVNSNDYGGIAAIRQPREALPLFWALIILCF